MGITGYDYASNINTLFDILGRNNVELYEVYLKIGSRESLSCFMGASNKETLENNFYMGNPLTVTILDTKFNTLFTVHINPKHVQFMKTKKVRATDEI